MIDAKGRPQYVKVLRLASKDSKLFQFKGDGHSAWLAFQARNLCGNPIPMPITMESPSTPRSSFRSLYNALRQEYHVVAPLPWTPTPFFIALPDLSLFTPPPGATETCSDAVSTASRYSQSPTRFSFGSSGPGFFCHFVAHRRRPWQPQDLEVSQSGGQVFDQSPLGAVQQWRFMPGTCDGDPMPRRSQWRLTSIAKRTHQPPRH